MPVSAGDPVEKDFKEAEQRGMRLLASAGIRDNFLVSYEHRFAKSEFSVVQKAMLECVASSRCLSAIVFEQIYNCYTFRFNFINQSGGLGIRDLLGIGRFSLCKSLNLPAYRCCYLAKENLCYVYRF